MKLSDFNKYLIIILAYCAIFILPVRIDFVNNTHLNLSIIFLLLFYVALPLLIWFGILFHSNLSETKIFILCFLLSIPFTLMLGIGFSLMGHAELNYKTVINSFINGTLILSTVFAFFSLGIKIMSTRINEGVKSLKNKIRKK